MPKMKNLTAQDFASVAEKVEAALYAIQGVMTEVEKGYYGELPDKLLAKDLMNLTRDASTLAVKLFSAHENAQTRRELEELRKQRNDA